MRKNKLWQKKKDISILLLDDDASITATLQDYFQSAGFTVDTEQDPNLAIERIRTTTYDILVLDFLMSPICGDEVVSQIRQFNKDLFIILLTGHKDLAPPIKTLQELDIQGYYEKSDRFDQLELLVESCVKAINQMRIVRNYRDGLGSILNSNITLAASSTAEEASGIVCDYMQKAFGLTDMFICLNSGDYFRTYRGCGVLDDTCSGKAMSLLNVIAALPAEARTDNTIAIASNAAFPSIVVSESEDAEQSEGVIICPLCGIGDEIFGIIGYLIPDDFKDYMTKLIQTYVQQTASTLNGMNLRFTVNMQNKQLNAAYARMKDNYTEIISAVRSMVDARDIYTRGHSDRVSHFSVLMAEALGKTQEEIEEIRIAALFHDIGKVSVSDAILLKNSRLTDEEYEQIKQHSLRGSNILSEIPMFNKIAPIVLSHHEWYNGKGYPNGIKGEEIPEQSRIISIADSFDAMTSSRRYRKNKSLAEAEEQLVLGKNTQFDANLVDVFIEILKDFDAIQEAIAWTYEDHNGSNE